MTIGCDMGRSGPLLTVGKGLLTVIYELELSIESEVNVTMSSFTFMIFSKEPVQYYLLL